ncbi:MAG: endonuclease MutS2 [Lachnospiraceae bacterium]|nr:endonuclease MutS2 [Lachnospiraceae bacterium]
MNERALRILEYNKIIDQLTTHASSEMGKEVCKNLVPSTDLAEIMLAQEQTKDALTRIYRFGSISFAGLKNITASLKRLEVQASLSSSELLDVARILEIVDNAKQYSDREDIDDGYDSLDGMFNELISMTALLLDIRRCIIAVDEISDEASSALKQIRRNIKATNNRVHTQLASIVNSQSNKSLLQDSIITMRNGRYCIPVKAGHRSSFPGMIHDQSSSGNTLFIEPMAVVQLNNQLKELELQEHAEIERILAALSEQVAFEAEDLAYNIDILKRLDFIFAKAKFARSYDGSEPLFNDEGIIEIKQGRHPLLDKKKVVPINLTLGDTFDMLIVTGPNTGGKTVSLKTVGLFSLMGQAGLHIPAFQGSRLTIFDEIFADIGDEQSIEQNLSTFSSHMTNIVHIVNHATPNSLVLLDELCGGTDPIEGAALAISILSNLLGRGIKTMATTHYSELKMFALSTPGIENASCEFDVETLSPTYRLLVGVPGKSNAFAISQKLGLDSTIIASANAQIDDSVQDFESLLSDLEQSKLKIEEEQEKIYAYKKEIEQLKESLKQKQDDVKEKRAQILQDAREEAYLIISEAKEVADESIKKYNNWGKHPEQNNTKRMEKKRSDLRKRMNDLEKDMAYKGKKGSGKHRKEDFSIGDEVWVTTLNLKGEVVSLPNAKGDLYVQMGMMRSLVNIKNLEITKSMNDQKKEIQRESTKKNRPKRANGGKTAMNKSATISPEINLLGLTVDEGIAKLEKYLDDAYLANLPQVRVVHGKGTGALRKGIQQYLRKNPYVSRFKQAEFGEGDLGVTIVYL